MFHVKKEGLTILGITSAAIGGAITFNKIINKNSNRNTFNSNNGYYYTCKDGSIYYDVIGKGKPILLIHDLNVLSSGYEWNEMINILSKKHKVYIIDLLGCGLSDKPNITYTNYTFVQIINEFCKEIIKEKCDVISSNDSCPIVLMVNILNDIFDNVILINPPRFDIYAMETTKKDLYEKNILCFPVIGTSFYNYYFSEKNIRSILDSYFENRNFTNKYIDAYYEASHKNNSNGRYLYAHKICSYISCDSRQAVEEKDNISIIIGSKYDNSIVLEYQKINSKIKKYTINNSYILPHIENPEEVKNVIEKII